MEPAPAQLATEHSGVIPKARLWIAKRNFKYWAVPESNQMESDVQSVLVRIPQTSYSTEAYGALKTELNQRP